MKIFALRPQLDGRGNFAYRGLLPVKKLRSSDEWRFKCTPKANEWPIDGAQMQPEPMHGRDGNFPFLNTSALIADDRARSELFPLFDGAAELLPLRSTTGQRYTLLNFLDCYDCVDLTATVWGEYPGWIARYEFISSKIPDRPIFKASARNSEIFITESIRGAAHEFRTIYERANLKGLCFREIWNDDGGHVEDIHIGNFLECPESTADSAAGINEA